MLSKNKLKNQWKVQMEENKLSYKLVFVVSMKNYVIMAKILIVFVAVIIIMVCGFYRLQIRPMAKEAEPISFVVEQGDTWYSISTRLYENGLIRAPKFYKVYIKLFKPGNLEAGEYTISKTMSLPEIIDTLEKAATNPNIVKVTFKEGYNMRAIAKTIADNTDNTEEDVFNTLADKDYINSLIEKYWFLDNVITNQNIYYSLEGYLYPATYEIDKTKDVKTIFAAMLDKMNTELTKYKEDIEKSNYTVHELLTLASIVELEAGNASDRGDVAGVFNNRVKNNWTLGSDVTTYYALKIDDFTYSLTNTELATCNKYNTRSTCFNGLPIGPISNPGDESIKASVYPTDTKAYYFVADCSGKTYLSSTYNEHNNIINKLKRENNWCQ